MQKKVIALAVAGLVSGAAFAQSNVTIYGVADAGYVYGTGDRSGAGNSGSANFSGIQSGLLAGSRIGFRGEEGLGNGLKAIFTLEYGLSIDADVGIGGTNGANGYAGTNSRQQFVGLSHNKLGTVALGQQYAPSFYAAGRNDAFMSSTGIGSLARLTIAGDNSISGTNPSRWLNAVTYTSPTWSGFSVRAAYGFAENGQQTAANGDGVSRGDNGKFGIGGNYANGPLNLDVVYHSRKDVSVANTGIIGTLTRDSINEWYVGGSYDFKVVKISGSYQDKNDSNGTSATEYGNNIWQVGATVPVFGNGKVYAGYSKLSQDRSGADDITAWNLMYTHALSKRTTLYTGVTRFDIDNGGLTAGASNSTVGAIGEKNTTYAAGINHTF